MSNRIIGLNLPTPHAAQAEIIQKARRFNVLCCGRRFGKTMLGMDRLIHSALQAKPVAWFSPTYKVQADTMRELRSTLGPRILVKTEPEKRLRLVNGCVQG